MAERLKTMNKDDTQMGIEEIHIFYKLSHLAI